MVLQIQRKAFVLLHFLSQSPEGLKCVHRDKCSAIRVRRWTKICEWEIAAQQTIVDEYLHMSQDMQALSSACHSALAFKISQRL